MSQVIRVYNVEGVGPVVSVASVGRILQEAFHAGVKGVAMERSIDAVSEINAEAQLQVPVRFVPATPGGGVVPLVVTIEHTWQ